MEYRKISAERLYFFKASGTHPSNAYLHFSFADYHDPDNMRFGVLRALSDESVTPSSGFGNHPHPEMEIFSYVIDGQLTHRDSVGNHEVLCRGHVQYMSAGTGVIHSELSEQDGSCRFLQTWILPEVARLPVRYGHVGFFAEER